MRGLRRVIRTESITRRWLVAGLLAAGLALAFSLLLLALSGWLIVASGLAGAGLIAMIDIFAPGAGIRAAAIGRTVSRYLERLVGHEATFRHLATLRVQALGQLLNRPVRVLSGMRSGDTLARLTRDVDALDQWVPAVLLPGGATLSVSLLCLSWLYILAPTLALVAGVWMLCAIALLVLADRLARSPGRAGVAAAAALRLRLADWLAGLEELISLDRSEAVGAGVLDAAQQRAVSERAQRRIEAGLNAGLTALGLCGFWLVFWLGLKLYGDGALAAPLIAAASLLALALVEPWASLAGGWSRLAALRAAGLRIDALVDAHDSIATPVANSAGEGPAVESMNLSLAGVSFSYSALAGPVLEAIELDVAAGERVLVQGRSGSGKSTLGQLVAGMLDPTRGTVRAGRDDLKSWAPKRRHATVAYLQQRPVLFQDTLAANLRLGDPGASSTRLEAMLRALGLGPLLEGLPDGLESRLGESGLSVSGGEARRIALARVLLTRAPIVVLDEPVAGLDPVTAGLVSEALEHHLHGRAALILSHDRGGLPRLDRVYRIRAGKLERVNGDEDGDERL